MPKIIDNIQIYESITEFVNARSETKAAKMIAPLLEGEHGEFISIDTIQKPCILIESNGVKYWSIMGCLPHDVAIKGKLRERTLVFPIQTV